MVNSAMRLVKNNKLIFFSYVITFVILVISFAVGFGIEDDFEEAEVSPSVLEIFFHNTLISIIFYVGSLTFGLVNFLLSVFNGFTFGTIFQGSISNIGVVGTVMRTVPHGLLEVPSIFISSSIGYIPLLLLIKKSNKKGSLNIKRYAKYYLYSFLLVIVLNSMAAIIEGLISYKL